MGNFEAPTIEDVGSHGLKHVEFSVWGLPHILQLVNVAHLKQLRMALASVSRESITHYGAYKLEAMCSYAGGIVYKGPLVPVAEVATSPLTINADVIIEGPHYEPALALFCDYVFDDIMRIGSSNSLHYIKDFYIEPPLHMAYYVSGKKMLFHDIRDSKQVFINELKNSVVQKRKAYIRVLVYVRKKFSIEEETGIPRTDSISEFLSATENENVYTDFFDYLPSKKVYSFHYVNTLKPDEPINSLCHLP
jgi:hypothetical protein